MSVWDAYGAAAALVRPGTPNVQIRWVVARGKLVVCADGVEVSAHDHYIDAHRWCMNTYQLTSTPMTAVYAEFQAHLETLGITPFSPEEVSQDTPDPKPNKYRKPAAQGVASQ